MVFISHSSKDVNLVNHLNSLLTSLGIKSEDIFCSSLEGQGVKNGLRISDEIQKNMKKSSLIIYVITQNFLKSTYCTNELGAGWILNDEKRLFILKAEDVKNEELIGFINSEYKYSLFDQAGISDLCDIVFELFNISVKISTCNRYIKNFLENAKEETAILVDSLNKTNDEILKERINNLEKQYELLPVGAKAIIADIYFSYEGVRYYSLSNGTVGSLESKLFLHRTTNVSTGFHLFAYELQPWVINFINNNSIVKQELEKISKNKKNDIPNEDDFNPFY